MQERRVTSKIWFYAAAILSGLPVRRDNLPLQAA
jgi:hypothetical protein